MTQFTHPTLLRLRPWLVLLVFAASMLHGRAASAQIADRISPNLAASERVTLKGSLHPLAQPASDRGRASSITKVPRMTLVFTPSAAQKADLAALLAAQQNPVSPSYHQWLTPAQFGARFGMSAHDLATTEAWLQAQGFTVLDVTNGRNAIHFSGTVAQVESAFSTEMHQYLVNGATHLANASELKLPSALVGSVAGIRGVAQFRPHAMHTPTRHLQVDPQFTSSTSGNHYIAPNDIATIYDINALYNAGYDGTGESIAIVGQSAITTGDIDAFRSAAGLTAKDPTLVLVPNTGASTIYSGDEDESDLDLEWSGAIAKNANIYFVYVGSDTNVGVFDALEYAIDQATAPVISASYGECESETGSDSSTLEPFFMQANAQGQTIISSAGDAGATGCDSGTSATQGLAVSYPASSPYVTAMGGTEFNEGSASYWNTANDSGGGSAISYIPEATWNETSTSNAQSTPGGLTSTGGGASILFGKPSWQVATNVPNDGARDVPDISLDAAVYHDGFLYCTEGSCTNGFRASDATLTVAGGTSFDAPIFAGILALIAQKNSSPSAGNVNSTLYSLYSTAPAAFHDITTGDNKQPCSSGSIDCPVGTSEIGYTAGIGYDQTTGLGSLDVFNLASVFPAPTTVTGSTIATTTSLAASTAAPVTGTAVTFTASVTANSGTSPATGTVNFSVDGGTPVAVALSNSAATYSATFTTTGAHTVVASYAGDSTYAASSSTLNITIASSTTTGSFTLTATNVSVTSGKTVDSAVTITAAGGYGGTVGFSYSAPTSFTGCLFAGTVGIGAGGTVTSSVTVDTLASDCVSAGLHKLTRVNAATASANSTNQPPATPGSNRSYPIAVAALLAGFGLLGRRRKAWPAAMVLMLGGLGMLSGCGGTSGSGGGGGGTTSSTYTITLTATDTSHPSQTASTTFTVTVASN